MTDLGVNVSKEEVSNIKFLQKFQRHEGEGLLIIYMNLFDRRANISAAGMFIYGKMHIFSNVHRDRQK